MSLRITRAIAVVALATLLAACAHRTTHAPGAVNAIPDEARQLVVVTIDDWDATTGTLRTYAGRAGAWKAAGASTPVTIGRTGAAWGIGLHPAQAGLQKREGDGRAPAGVFAIGTAFGYGAHARTGLPYAAMTASDWCIDVPASPLYNRLVDSADVGEAAVAGSTEPMRRDLHVAGDQGYREGFVIAHNPGNAPGAGSCIFAHLWKAPGAPTAGCTAMPAPAMTALLRWLDAASAPVFVLLPDAEYARLQADWRLPAH